MEGTRPLLVEVQALLNETNFGYPKRQATGTDYNRVSLLMAVMEKRLGLPLGQQDAYVNLAGGIRQSEPALDLGIALAVVSSYRNRPIDDKLMAFGEIGLSGEIRAVSQAEHRVQEAPGGAPRPGGGKTRLHDGNYAARQSARHAPAGGH